MYFVHQKWQFLTLFKKITNIFEVIPYVDPNYLNIENENQEPSYLVFGVLLTINTVIC